jgi:hypothetical protein
MNEVVILVLQQWCTMVNEQIENKWGTLSRIGTDRHIEKPSYVQTMDTIVATLKYSGLSAFIAEFGSGSLMSRDNPWLDEYLSSDEFNQWRLHSSRMPIMGRSEGEEYKDINGETHVSTGRMQGLDLERDGNPEYQPISASHVISEYAQAALPELRLMLTRALGEYIAQQLIMDIKLNL